MRLIIAGSRDFNDYEFLEAQVLAFIKRHRKNNEPVEIISGGARGADRLGEKFADRFTLTKNVVPAEWDKYGKSAGYRRNQEMADIASHCIVLWDGKSRGTGHMLDLARQKKLVLEIVQFIPHRKETL